MSDARWSDVQADLDKAIAHFKDAVEEHQRGGFNAPGHDGRARSAAFQFFVQSGYTSFEAAMHRILKILSEEAPTGIDSHKDLIERLSREQTDRKYARPALFSPEVSKDLTEAMRARHRARHSYDDFEAERAAPTVEAIKRLIVMLPATIGEFRKKVDPAPGEDHDGGGDGVGGGP